MAETFKQVNFLGTRTKEKKCTILENSVTPQNDAFLQRHGTKVKEVTVKFESCHLAHPQKSN